MLEHEGQNGAGGQTAGVAPRRKPATAQEIRDQSGEMASLELLQAIKSSGQEITGVADALGITRQRVSSWCDPFNTGSPFTLRDMLALAELCPAVYRALLDSLSEYGVARGPGITCEKHVCLILVKAGELGSKAMEIMADGVETEEERRSLIPLAQALLETVRRFNADVRR